MRFFWPVVGVFLVAAGVVLCFIPGPGIPLIIAGAALLAERWMTLARALDWVEVKIRNGLKRGMAWWKQATLTAKTPLMLLAAFTLASAGYGGYRMFFA